jgi:BirA family biotin operon repressor/biotin-[acetyl-CoA-carboxylase] ligase
MSVSAPFDGRPWPFVRSMVLLDEVDSTSNRAAQLVREESVELPLCIWARRQTHGRGRGTHSWWSDSGSLTFTVAIDPTAQGLAGESEPKLALGTAVSVIDALDELGYRSPALGIRWPNDIEVNGRKLGGILPERVETSNGHRILIGVGVNVSTDPAAMPAEIRHMATSLSAMREGSVGPETLARLLATILDHFGSVLGRLIARDPELARRWNALDMLRDQSVSVDLGTRLLAGRGRGIDEDGALCLDEGPSQHRLLGGQVLR